MTLQDLLRKNESAITDKWLDRILDTYPSRAALFYRSKKDPFANPVGHALRTGTTALFEDLLAMLDVSGRSPADRLFADLDGIMRVRTVQEFTPSQAVWFVFALKQVVREELADELGERDLSAELAGFETLVDQMALAAVDIYWRYRERVYELRINEIKRTGFRLLRKANLISTEEDLEPMPEENVEEA